MGLVLLTWFVALQQIPQPAAERTSLTVQGVEVKPEGVHVRLYNSGHETVTAWAYATTRDGRPSRMIRDSYLALLFDAKENPLAPRLVEPGETLVDVIPASEFPTLPTSGRPGIGVMATVFSDRSSVGDKAVITDIFEARSKDWTFLEDVIARIRRAQSDAKPLSAIQAYISSLDAASPKGILRELVTSDLRRLVAEGGHASSLAHFLSSYERAMKRLASQVR